MTIFQAKRGKIFYSILSLAIFLCLGILARTPKADAMIFATNVYPDTTYPAGGGDSYAIVQVTGWNVPDANTKMKARTTIADIYVPFSMVNQNISLTIVGGCDGSTRDNDSSFGSTDFYVFSDTEQLYYENSKNASAGCTGSQKNISVSFPARATNASDFRFDNQYYVYRFYASGYMVEAGSDHRYLNAFRLLSNTANVSPQIATNWQGICEIGTYPMSCPRLRTAADGTTQSVVYSSFYGPYGVSPYGQTARIPTGCKGGTGRLSIYDLDANDATLGPNPGTTQNLSMTISYTDNSGYHAVASLNHSMIQNWAFANPGYGGNNDEYLDLPSGSADFTFQPNAIYSVTITGLSGGNAFQLQATIHNTSTTTGCGDTGPSCSITSLTNMTRGGTTFYPNDRIGFRVHVENASTGNYTLGANGESYGVAVYGNYLVSGWEYARTPIGMDASGNGDTDVTLYGKGDQSHYRDYGPYDQEIRAPGPGDYAFNWGLIQLVPTPSAGPMCAGLPLHVDPLPNITVSGKLYAVHDMNMVFANSPVQTCADLGGGNTIVYTNGNGDYSFTVPLGAAFCIRSQAWPSGTTGAYARPTTEAYLGCGPYDRAVYASPNYCTTIDTYECQVAGQAAAIGCGINNIDRAYDGGYDLVFTMPMVQGRFFDADDMNISYANIPVITCIPGVNPVTGADGSYSFYVPSGTPFCIRAGSWPQYAADANVRPWSEGYYGCPGYGAGYASPNYCVTAGTYECQTAGFLNSSGCGIPGIDRANDWGYDIVFRIPKVTVQGNLANAYSRSTKYSGITITTCVPGVSATTDANGNFSFVLRKGTGFCIRPNSAPANAVTYNVRPWGVGYAVCPAYGSGVATPDYCGSFSTYEWQQAGIAGTSGAWAVNDRHGEGTYDYGYDIVFRFRPQISCSISTNSPVEAGVPNNLTVTMTATDGGGSTRPTITSGTANYDVVGLQAANGAFGALSPRGTAVDVTPAPSVMTANAANVYTINASVNATGDGISSGNVTCTGTATVTAADYPYLKIYGADIRAGGGFGSGTCNSSTGGVFGFGYRPGTPATSTDYRGTSSQLGIMSLLNVNGVYSAAQRTASPTVPRGLTFSSTGGDSTYGGDFDGTASGGGICIPDYFNNTRSGSVGKVGTVNAAIAASPEGKSQYTANTLGGSGDITVPLRHQVAVYIDGNLVIDRNITLATGAGQPSDLPFFALIVRGNIYIAPNVSRLDGLYIAQPNNGQQATQGRIYTCSNGATPYVAANIATACDDNQLVINGALVAQQVKFLRTLRSLRDTPSTSEAPNFANGTGTNAAEVINYTPEMYIAPSPLLDPVTSAAGTGVNRYDAIYSLPPVY